MRMKPKTLAGLIILFLIVSLIPPVEGNGWPEEQTRHIEAQDPGFDADWFVTETGSGFSTSLVTVLDPNMDIYAYLWFEDMKINTWFHLENATLRLHTASSLAFDADSSVTIYGVPDYRFFGSGSAGQNPYGAPSSIMNSPLTSANVVLNTSQFYGSKWWDIDVTNIVQELKSNPWYDGPGMVYADPGDNMAFIILGAGGHDTRYFYDLSAGNGFEAQLHLHWDFSPSPPDGYEDAVFNKTYGNYTIWELPGGLGYPPEPIEYVYTNGSLTPWTMQYDDDGGSGPFDVADSEFASVTALQSQRKLTRLDNGTLYTIYWKELGGLDQIYVKASEDEGATWINDERISINAPKNMADYDQDYPAIAVDSHDRLHAVWYGRDDDYAQDQVWYSRWTGTWSTPVRLSIHTNFYGGFYASIAVDSNDSIHVVYDGRTNVHPTDFQIWHTVYTDSWSASARISLVAGMEDEDNSAPTIEIDSDDSLHVAYRGNDGSGVWLWYTKYDAGWSASVELSTSATGSTASIAINSDDHIFAVYGDYFDGGSDTQVLLREYDGGSWLPEVRLSNYSGMDALTQNNPSIAIDSNDSISVVWSGKADGVIVDTIWYALNNGSWQMPPVLLQPLAKNVLPNLRWSRWPMMGEETYLVTDSNGTVLEVDLESIEDAEDWIDLYDTDPEDPNPAGAWDTGPGEGAGAFTRFRMRLWFLILGFGCFFGPIMVFAWRRPSGSFLMAGCIVMLIGLGLLMSITQV